MATSTIQSPTTLGLAPDVLFVRDDPATSRLLDMRRGRFFALDAVAARMLDATLADGPAQAADRLAAEFRVDRDRVAADLSDLLGLLRRRGLVTTPAAARPARRPGVVRVLALLTLAWVGVRLLGWVGTLRLLRRAAGLSKSLAATSDDLQRFDDVLRAAAAWHPLNPQCKERALACWFLLRTWYGAAAELVVGSQPYPFALHVWVECGGRVLTDDPVHCDTFSPVARYA